MNFLERGKKANLESRKYISAVTWSKQLETNESFISRKDVGGRESFTSESLVSHSFFEEMISKLKSQE